MSIYPISVEAENLLHRGGTKFYSIVTITNSDGKAVVAYRWGRVGAFGQVKVENYTATKPANKARDAKFQDKLKKGYAPDTRNQNTTVTVNSEAELPKAVGRGLFNKLGRQAVRSLDPDFDIAGMREYDEPAYDEETGRKRDTGRKADFSEQIAAQEKERKRAEAQQIAQDYAANPQFGMF